MASNLESRINELETSIVRLEEKQEGMKETLIEIKESLGKLNSTNSGSTVWQKSLIGMLLVQNLMHGGASPDIVKDLLGMIRGH